MVNGYYYNIIFLELKGEVKIKENNLLIKLTELNP